MRTREEINHFIGFCQTVRDTFPVKIVNVLSEMSEREFPSFRQTLNSCITDKKACLLTNGTEQITLRGKQRIVALNILDWLENV